MNKDKNRNFSQIKSIVSMTITGKSELEAIREKNLSLTVSKVIIFNSLLSSLV